MREQKEKHFDILIRIAQVASSTLELRDILDTILQIIADTMNKDICSIYLFKQERKVIRIEAMKGRTKESITASCLQIEEDGLLRRVTRELRPVVIEDKRKRPRIMDSNGLFATLAVPILKGHTPIGIMIVQTRQPYTYTQDEIDLFTVISHNISVAIQNAELYRSVKTQLDELKIIHEIGKSITSILNIDQLLPYICEEVSKLFNARGCILRLLEGEELQIKASYGLPDKIKEEMTLRLGEGIAGWVAETGKPLLVDDVSRMPKNLRVPVIEVTSVLCVPLEIGGRIIGTLGLYDKKDEWGVTTFTRDDISTLKTFASQASIAIENARLYKEEVEKEKKILSLYWDVTQTKDYLKSIIDNSADAIITSDINGIITSWNKQAEKIYGYTEDEALGKFLPMVPPFLIEEEKSYIKKILQKETIVNLETIRQRKDGKLIEVSLTLSPILDSSGNVTGISGISRDISEKKRVEKELIKRNQELSRLFFINSVIRSTLELDKLLRMVLTVVTMSDGLGFNRAVLFLVDESHNILKGVMGVGPANAEEAGNIWRELSMEGKTLEQIISEIETGPLKKDSFLDKLSQSISINLNEGCVLSKCVTEKRPFNIQDATSDPMVNPVLTQQLGTKAFGVVPLITKNRAIGVILVDNLFTGKPIKDEELRFLMEFTSHIAPAIENARLFESVSLAESELKNIFESMSDMVFFTDKDCNIRRVNQAVVKRLGKPEKEIIGQKCYKIFHGLDKPWEKCPHSKAMDSQKSFVEEIEDPYLGGTFVVSNSPIFDSSGNFVGTVHISRDITELHSLRERVVHSERMAALGELAAKVAHEIRNPLISIGGFARRLEKRLTGDTREYARIIVNEVSRLENILKEILGFVKSSRIQKSLVDINELLSSILDFITPEIQERRNSLIREISDSPIQVKIDQDRIKAAVLNIITNANEATENGIIMIKTMQKDGEAIIEISDTGHGIKPEHLKNIFNPFFTTKPQGTGLGLAVTHKIIEEHNGRITVKSIYEGDEAQRGTTFRIYLPMAESKDKIQ